MRPGTVGASAGVCLGGGTGRAGGSRCAPASAVQQLAQQRGDVGDDGQRGRFRKARGPALRRRCRHGRSRAAARTTRIEQRRGLAEARPEHQDCAPARVRPPMPARSAWPPMPVTPMNWGCASGDALATWRAEDGRAGAPRARQDLVRRATGTEADPDREGLVDQRDAGRLHGVGRRAPRRSPNRHRSSSRWRCRDCRAARRRRRRRLVQRSRRSTRPTAPPSARTTCATKTARPSTPRASCRATSGQSRSSSRRCATWNRAPLSYSPRGERLRPALLDREAAAHSRRGAR